MLLFLIRFRWSRSSWDMTDAYRRRCLTNRVGLGVCLRVRETWCKPSLCADHIDQTMNMKVYAYQIWASFIEQTEGWVTRHFKEGPEGWTWFTAWEDEISHYLAKNICEIPGSLDPFCAAWRASLSVAISDCNEDTCQSAICIISRLQEPSCIKYVSYEVNDFSRPRISNWIFVFLPLSYTGVLQL